MKKLLVIVFFFNFCFSQEKQVNANSSMPPVYKNLQVNSAWQNPLKMAWSNDGVNFSNSSVFQDSSGVPSVVKWKGDTLVCAFQWFPMPMFSPSWDKVGVKFSYDAGITWTNPTLINFVGLPTNYQRPFDPTLAVINNDSIRIYFSSSNGMPVGGLDSLVNTYSAIGTDGVNFNFEPNARYDDLNKPVIDPAAVFFNGEWHYTAPAGAPQDGAHHATSLDGINFTNQAVIPSDNQHNWTGNLMLESPTEMRFYGSGSSIWYNPSSDGFNWQGFVNTNVIGGDPAVVKISNSNYLMIYVGQPPAPVFNCGDTLIDNRDGKKYNTVLIGNQCWMKQNLNFGVYKANTLTTTPHSDVSNNGVIEKYCYNNDTTTAFNYGGYYDWNELMNYQNIEGSQGICPLGWHIPSLAEYQTLIAFANNNGNSLKMIGQGLPPLGLGTNSTGFSAKLTGDRGSMGDFNGVGLVGTFWTSTQTNASDAKHIYLIADNDSIKQWTTQKMSGFNCRCIQNQSPSNNDLSLNPNLIVYPNPFQNKITINTEQEIENSSLMNVMGQVLWTGKHIENEDFSKLENGFYFLRVQSKNQSQTLKLIKNQ